VHTTPDLVQRLHKVVLPAKQVDVRIELSDLSARSSGRCQSPLVLRIKNVKNSHAQGFMFPSSFQRFSIATGYEFCVGVSLVTVGRP
jgi:hypothetical protein